MKTFYSPMHTVLVGKASEVFDEIAQLAKWERFGISYKVFTLTVFCLN